tara:strand:- start:6258 stop:6989 length:732 start_codon:yes stop_codon:yes gene_type:complete
MKITADKLNQIISEEVDKIKGEQRVRALIINEINKVRKLREDVATSDQIAQIIKPLSAELNPAQAQRIAGALEKVGLSDAATAVLKPPFRSTDVASPEIVKHAEKLGNALGGYPQKARAVGDALKASGLEDAADALMSAYSERQSYLDMVYSVLEEDEFAGVRVKSQGRAKGEVAGSANTKQIQNLTQRVFQIENAFKQIGGIEQIVRLTRRVFALEKAAKGGQQNEDQTFEEWLTVLAEEKD